MIFYPRVNSQISLSGVQEYKNINLEGRIEKSVTRVAVWYHEVCRVMTNGDPEGRIFLSYPHMIMDFFLAHHCFYLFDYLFILK